MALSVRPYTVRQGDTLSSIARKRGELSVGWRTACKEVFRDTSFFLACQGSSLLAPAFLTKQLCISALHRLKEAHADGVSNFATRGTLGCHGSSCICDTALSQLHSGAAHLPG